MRASHLQRDVHPAIVDLGVKYSSGVIVGATARCLAMLDAFRRVIADYQVPADKVPPCLRAPARCMPATHGWRACRPLLAIWTSA